MAEVNGRTQPSRRRNGAAHPVTMPLVAPAPEARSSTPARAVTSAPTGRESVFGIDEVIVSKTDLKGHLTYVNDVFQRVSGFSEAEMIGQPHNVIRHPDMPRCVYSLLWKTIQSGKEIFAYVVNLSKNGDHYWVFAHVTPTFDTQGNIIGYHSNRRHPDADAIAKVKPLYAALLAEEKQHARPKDGIEASIRLLERTLAEQRTTYDEFVFSLSSKDL